MNFELNSEQRAIQDMVRKFAKEKVAPLAHHTDEASEFPAQNFKAMAELGLLGLPVPEEYGGVGADTISYVIAVEELSAACGSTGLSYAAHTSLACMPLLWFGNEAQKQRYLTHLAQGKGLGAFGLTEPQSGSDAAGLRTTATRDGDGWLLNGQKMWITSGSLADVVLVAAVTDAAQGAHGISNFIVEKGTPGFIPGKDEPKMGMKGSITSQLFFDNCRVPASNVIGETGKGYKIAIETLNEGRIAIGGQMIGLARGALGHALAYAKQRKQFGRPIADFQAVQLDLASMATDLEAARLLVYNAARLRESGQPFLTEAAMAKYFSSRIAEEVASRAVEIFGGVGFTKDYPVEKLYRDAKIGRIYEGTSNMQRLTIAKQLLA